MELEYIFKKYGKEKMVNWINDYYTKRININMPVHKIIYILDIASLKEDIEQEYKDMGEYTKYIILGEYFIK
tara:strand:+ start:81 stop:296 length:216 start_codon:yes stop_codon:yes gene_type:complete